MHAQHVFSPPRLLIITIASVNEEALIMGNES